MTTQWKLLPNGSISDGTEVSPCLCEDDGVTAPRIVRAVNNHDALVSALRRISDWTTNPNDASNEDRLNAVGELADFALAAVDDPDAIYGDHTPLDAEDEEGGAQ